MAGNSSYEGKRCEKAGGSGLEKPLVSVVIPVHNGAGTLPQALDSALSQEVPVEILVVDDCSTDGLEAVRERYAADSRIIWKQNLENLGAAKSRNRAVREARGNYVAFLDSDDYWASGKLKKQLAVMEREKCVLCSTGRELITPDGKPSGRMIGVKQRITYRDLLRHNCINCSSVLLLRTVALEFPMEHEDSHEDYITWLKILEKYGFASGINEPLLKYRLSNSGKSGSKAKSAVMTFRVYRYMGFGWGKSLLCFISYALHGAGKYLLAEMGKNTRRNTA